MPYLLDANIFIQAKNLHYGFDFCPAFWEWLHAGNEQGKVFSIEKVRDELIGGDDELAEGRKHGVLSSSSRQTLKSSQVSRLLAAGPGVAAMNLELSVNSFR
jgi:hypothetical protein